MIKNKKTKEKVCAFYASDYHFEMISLPYIIKKLQDKNEIIIITQNNLEESIQTLLSKMNLKDEKKQNILKINWNNNNEEKLEMIKNKTKSNKEITIFIKGEEDYIKKTNKNIEDINLQNTKIKIINCYNIEEIGENLNQIMSQYKKILKTAGEQEI